MTGAALTTAVFIDVANAEGVDWSALLTQVRSLGRIDEIRAYADFRQRHLDETIELYALGMHLVHCPSWSNGGQWVDGYARRRRTDDRVLEKEVRDLLCLRRGIDLYILVSADADIIPTLHALSAADKDVQLSIPESRRGSAMFSRAVKSPSGQRR